MADNDSTPKPVCDTDKLLLRRWRANTRLAQVYVRALQTFTAHNPISDYSVIAHGSVIWGGWTLLRNGLPVSDIDLLLVGKGKPDLVNAASVLSGAIRSLTIPEMPFFKVSVKFRTFDEISSLQITVNELAALLHGRVLCGERSFDVFRPDSTWFRSQASLGVRTRIAYVAKQRESIRGNPFELALARYLAARIILDIPTIGLLLEGIVGQSYDVRAKRFLQMLAATNQLDSVSLNSMQETLTAALQTKGAPETYQCGTVEEAMRRLLDFAARMGLPPDSFSTVADKFWELERPLDLRDQVILREASAA